MVPSPAWQLYVRPHMILTFNLVTLKVYYFMPLFRGPFMPICSGVGSSISKISRSQVRPILASYDLDL